MLARRNIQVLVMEPDMPWRQRCCGGLFVLGFLLWVYEAVAYAVSWPYHLPPPGLHAVLMSSLTVKLVGLVVMAGGLLVYGLALLALGEAWRVGIDRTTPSLLVTRGIFAWSRNPIYVGLDGLIVGTFLVQGRLLFLGLALGLPMLLHVQIRYEETFLQDTFGEMYRGYCAHVGRYVRFR
jgi:protein-S-isoprenylcysteine O-methyltransferase Ste14